MNLRECLRGIHEERGRVTPDLLVEAATPEDHPLHRRFEWDDSIAGPAYRRVQAAELIRSVKVTYRDSENKAPRTTREWVAPRQAAEPNVYQPVEVVATDPLLRAMVLRQMERDWRDLKRRYAEFEEFWRLVSSDADAA